MSSVTRFLFDGLDIRGAVARLTDCWQSLCANRGYGPVEAALLGEMSAVAALIAAQLKQPGRLTFQLRGEGPVSLLVVDCDERLRMKAVARAQPGITTAPASQLLGADQGGQLMLSLDLPTSRQPYQSFVPLLGDSIAAIFEHYLVQSEQQETRLFAAADAETAACLFLQKMPDADQKDADGWARLSQLVATVKPEELLRLDATALLSRLFHEDIADGGVRVFEPRAITHHAPEDREKVANMLLALGQDAARDILAKQGSIHIRDDLCNREYVFTAGDIDALFSRAIH